MVVALWVAPSAVARDEKPVPYVIDELVQLERATTSHYERKPLRIFDHPGYRELKGSFCFEGDAYWHALEKVQARIDDVCSRKGGVLERWFCTQSREPDSYPAFFAMADEAWGCGAGGKEVTLIAIEPKISNRTDPGYRAAVAGHGYLTPAQAMEKKIQRAKSDIEAERRRQQAPLLRKLGTKVCHDDHEFRYVGFVDGFTDEKIRLQVDHVAYVKNPANLANGFVPHVVWDYPDNWFVCE